MAPPRRVVAFAECPISRVKRAVCCARGVSAVRVRRRARDGSEARASRGARNGTPRQALEKGQLGRREKALYGNSGGV